jgi:hypothetical protein
MSDVLPFLRQLLNRIARYFIELPVLSPISIVSRLRYGLGFYNRLRAPWHSLKAQQSITAVAQPKDFAAP